MFVAKGRFAVLSHAGDSSQGGPYRCLLGEDKQGRRSLFLDCALVGSLLLVLKTFWQLLNIQNIPDLSEVDRVKGHLHLLFPCVTGRREVTNISY